MTGRAGKKGGAAALFHLRCRFLFRNRPDARGLRAEIETCAASFREWVMRARRGRKILATPARAEARGTVFFLDSRFSRLL
jgi:hypothetical protein